MRPTPDKAFFCADDIRPFHGYRRLSPDRKAFLGEYPELHTTIEHFFQSERFRDADEMLRREVMAAPSAKEARKLAMRHADKQRPDWHLIEDRVMAAGIWMKLREYPGFARLLVTAPDASEDRYPFRDARWANFRPGVSGNAYAIALRQIRGALQRQTIRAAITGSRSFSNEFMLHAKLDSLFRTSPPDVVLVGSQNRVDDMVERWAISHQFPVRHVGFRAKRSVSERDRHHRALLRVATHMVVFSAGDRDMTALLSASRSAGLQTRKVTIPASAAAGGRLR